LKIYCLVKLTATYCAYNKNPVYLKLQLRYHAAFNLIAEIFAMPSTPSKTLEIFDNPNSERDYTIHIETPEFTCLCPKTGQPDFATLYLDYVPDKSCIELKSFKMYIWSYRDAGAFHEAVTNQILTDFVEACEPRFMRLTAKFNVRGGVYTTVVAEHQNPDWTPKPVVQLP